MTSVVAAPMGRCKHGTPDMMMQSGILRARGYCTTCKQERRAAAREAAKTRKARGTCWSRSFISDHYQTWTVMPSWLAAKHEEMGDWVIVNDRIVHSPTRSPVWIVDMHTYRVAELLDLDRLKDLLGGRVVLGDGTDPLFCGLSTLTIAPQSAIDGGETLELYGLACAPPWHGKRVRR